ncbi:MAG: Gfo/Idh/MocA family oxidoreductase [Chloroflexi bacterium]|nr:Gfo/Idh/MocA family oxidoreductase [Chloroflexota bacterium]
MNAPRQHEPVRWGILGTGGITRSLLRGARRTDAVDVVAVGSRTLDRAAEYAREHGIARAHGSYEALLADPDVEAVYISLPNSLHHPWTVRALQAGKHVLCEKPYTRRHTDVAAAFEAAEHAGLVLCEAFMWRHHPQARAIVEMLPEIGELQTIRATFSFVLDRPNDIRLRADLDGGSLMDVGTYCVSGARLLTGEEPELVFGTQVLGPSGVDVRFNALLRFPGGAIAEIMSSFETDHRGLEAIGSEGTIRLTNPWLPTDPDPILIRDGVETPIGFADSYQLELEDVSAAIREHRPTLLGRADAMGQARAIEALYRSADSGLPVRL